MSASPGSADLTAGELWLWGALSGVLVSPAFTLSRWATWEPYSPLLIPYDLFVCVLAGVGVSLVSALIARKRFGEFAAGAGTVASLVILLGGVWASALRGTGGGGSLKALSLGIFGAAGFVFWRAARRRRGGIPAGWFFLALGGSLSGSLVGYQNWKPLALLFPTFLALAFAFGIPRFTRLRSAHLRVPLLSSVVVTAVCAWTVYPGSSQIIDTSLHTAPGDAPSFIVIVVDTLRQDHMSLYGYSRETTPNIDRWARGGLVFEDATAASSWTLPSHASMFTGLFPRSHGAHGYRSSPGDSTAVTSYPLDTSHVTIAEVLSAAGWETAAVIANHGFLAPRFQLDQGFGTYWVPAPQKGFTFPPSDRLAQLLTPWSYLEFSWRYYRDRFVVDNVERWLSAAKGRPFFLFVNFMDVHYPNQRPADETVPLEDEVPLQDVYFRDTGDRTRVDPLARFFEDGAYDREQVHAFVSEDQPLDPAVRRELVNNYDRELRHLDAQLGRLFDYLDATGLSATTNVVLTSDHGEYFGEHGLVFHSKHLHQEVVRVPFILKGPGVEVGRSTTPVQQVDIFPTVLDLLDVPFEGRDRLAGKSVLKGGNMLLVSEWYAAPWPQLLDEVFLGRFDRNLRAVRRKNFKLLIDDNGPMALFDLARDPGESENLVDVLPDIVAMLSARDRAWLTRYKLFAPTNAFAPPDSDSDEIKRLRALGYIR